MIDIDNIAWPPHGRGGLFIWHNDHLSNYETAEE